MTFYELSCILTQLGLNSCKWFFKDFLISLQLTKYQITCPASKTPTSASEQIKLRETRKLDKEKVLRCMVYCFTLILLLADTSMCLSGENQQSTTQPSCLLHVASCWPLITSHTWWILRDINTTAHLYKGDVPHPTGEYCDINTTTHYIQRWCP